MATRKDDRWVPVIRESLPRNLSDEAIISHAKSVRFRYLPPGFDSTGLLQLRFLHTCESLGIPPDLWPDFGQPEIPIPRLRHVILDAFKPPPFNVMTDTADSWRKRADKAWSEYCNSRMATIRGVVDGMVESGLLIRQKQTREGGASPFRFRLIWAARHYCQGWSYQRIFQNPQCNPEKHYSVHAVTRAVQTLLKQLGLARSAGPRRR